MKVALTSEGTYPHQYGGVSVWCDQLISGLPQHEFALVPLVATGSEPMRWQLPPNVTSVRTIPLWGPPPPAPLRSLRPRPRHDDVLAELIDVLLSPPGQAQDRFRDVLRKLFDCGQAGHLRPVLESETAVRLLGAAWRRRWPEILPESPVLALMPNGADAGHGGGPGGQARFWRTGDSPAHVRPTVGDAVVAMQFIEHALRPFSHPPATADLVHAVTNGLGALPAMAAKWCHELPMIVTEHGIYLREHYLFMRRPAFGWPVKDMYLRFLRRVCALGYQEADLITPGNSYNKRWEAELGADLSRVRTVYNGVDPAAFPLPASEPEVPTISWAGRIDQVKDLVTLLRAFSLVVKDIPQARLRIFGGAPPGGEAYLERCRREAADLGISSQATFEGRVPEIRDAYAAGHIFVLSSITEGFPYTLIEAMACGRACVATDVGGVSEAIGAAEGIGAAGLIVPPRNPVALAEACLRLLRDDNLRWAMGAVGRARAMEHFTVDRTIGAFDEIYTKHGSGAYEAKAAPPESPDAEQTLVVPAPGRTRLPDTEQTQVLPVLNAEAAGQGSGNPTGAAR